MNRGLRVSRSCAIALVLTAAVMPPCAADDAAPAVDTGARRSGYDYMGRETRAMQDDDAANPGMLWVLDGEALWKRKAGAAERSCFDCHGDARSSMKGVAARYPAFSAERARPVNLEQRINLCRTEQQKAQPLAYESKDLLALSAYVGRQSRGLPIAIAIDARSKPFLDAGRETYNRRQGQLNLACAQCHDANSGKRLAGNVIPQAHPTGYPIYRLEWQGAGSLERRLRNCMFGTRAQTPEFGSEELVDLELFLMWRAQGMKVETPAVRP
jgi:sulfur-oxidizing protein SoxA